MKIAICIKQVPDTSEVAIDPQTGVLLRGEAELILNPDDHAAIEAGLQIREGLKTLQPEVQHEVVLFTMGLPKAEAILLQGLSMGADRGCLITDPCYAGSDTLATAYVLCKALRVEGGFDLVLCGRQAIDGDTAQVGPMLAELLGRPHLTCVDEILSVESEGLILHRIFSNCAERIFMPYGSLLTVTKGKIRPRAVNTMRLLKVRKSKNLIRTISQKELELDQSRVGLEGSLTRVIRSQYIRYDKTDRTVLSGTPAELSAQIRNIIQEHRQA